MNNFTYDVCIIGGAGHVGLPLGISLADAGKRVVLYDKSAEALQSIANGRMPFMEAGAEDVLRKVVGKTLHTSTDKRAIYDSRYVVVVIGTPVDEHLNPEFSMFKRFFANKLDKFREGQHVILRSTIFPGTTELVYRMFRDAGVNVGLSFCPERIAEGKAMEELRSLPQIVSAFDERSEREAAELFGSLTKDIIRLKPKEAEFAKIFTNVWRYIQFSISNQFYQIAARDGVDFHSILKAMKHNYPRTDGLYGPGFTAGPCLLKDTMQLAAYSNNTFFLGHASMLVNEGMPNFLVGLLKSGLDLSDKTVGILGMAFKAESDDIRDSLSYKLKKLFEIEARTVLCADPHVKDGEFVTAEDLVGRADVIVVGAPHAAYKKLAIDFGSKIVVDIWNFFGRGTGIKA